MNNIKNILFKLIIFIYYLNGFLIKANDDLLQSNINPQSAPVLELCNDDAEINNKQNIKCYKIKNNNIINGLNYNQSHDDDYIERMADAILYKNNYNNDKKLHKQEDLIKFKINNDQQMREYTEKQSHNHHNNNKNNHQQRKLNKNKSYSHSMLNNDDDGDGDMDDMVMISENNNNNKYNTNHKQSYNNNNKEIPMNLVNKKHSSGHGQHKHVKQNNRHNLRTQYNTYPVISTHHREENGFDCYQDVSDQYKIVCGTKANHNRRNRPNKWPNFTRLRKHLQHEQEDDIYVPPYVKKFRRRNKQLLDLLEGTISPSEVTNSLPIYSTSYRISSKQQKPLHQQKLVSSIVIHSGEGDNRRPDLFEEQRKATAKPNHFNVDVDEGIDSNADPNDMLSNVESYEEEDNSLKNTRAEFTNDIPGDGEDILYKHIVNGRKINKSGNRMTGNDGTSISNYKLSPKSDRFIYHRVVSPKLIGVGDNYGDIKKQRLPFVAITDKRLGPPSAAYKSRLNASNNNQSNSK